VRKAVKAMEQPVQVNWAVLTIYKPHRVFTLTRWGVLFWVPKQILGKEVIILFPKDGNRLMDQLGPTN